MSGFDELHRQCERRGWRLRITGHYPNGRRNAGVTLTHLDVVSSWADHRDLLARVPLRIPAFDEAALDAAKALHDAGMIA